MKALKNVALADFTSLKVGGLAENLFVIESDDNLVEVIKNVNTSSLWVLGSGTNALISDLGLPGTVIINSSGSIKLVEEITVKVDSGTNWDELVRFVISQNLYGLEFMSGIPGTVGGAVVGNIAAYGQKVADTLTEITVFNLNDNSVKTIPSSQLDLGYRSSNLQFKRHLVVIDATFNLSKTCSVQLEYESAIKVANELKINPDSLNNRRLIILETRNRAGSLLNKTSNDNATAGSFFRNPIVDKTQVEKILSYEEAGISPEQLLRQNSLHSGDSTRVSAAHILLASGFKRGQTWGKVRLHPNHILKIENMGGATAQEIYDVVQYIVGTVKAKLNIDLNPEVQFLGHFN